MEIVDFINNNSVWQGRKKAFTKLPVRDPWFCCVVFFKGKGINKNRLALRPLDIEWCCIFQNHSKSGTFSSQFQRQKSCILQHIKAPFVRITDEGNSLRLQCLVPTSSARKIVGYLFMGNQPLFFYKMIVTSAADKMIKILFEDIIYLPIKNAIFFKHKTRRITKRWSKWLCDLLWHCIVQELFFCDPVKNDLTYHQAFLKNLPIFLKKKAIPRAPAIMAWIR